ncbi:hypothetical protein D9M71_301230 [compost metagenome]
MLRNIAHASGVQQREGPEVGLHGTLEGHLFQQRLPSLRSGPIILERQVRQILETVTLGKGQVGGNNAGEECGSSEMGHCLRASIHTEHP